MDLNLSDCSNDITDLSERSNHPEPAGVFQPLRPNSPDAAAPDRSGQVCADLDGEVARRPIGVCHDLVRVGREGACSQT